MFNRKWSVSPLPSHRSIYANYIDIIKKGLSISMTLYTKKKKEKKVNKQCLNNSTRNARLKWLNDIAKVDIGNKLEVTDEGNVRIEWLIMAEMALLHCIGNWGQLMMKTIYSSREKHIFFERKINYQYNIDVNSILINIWISIPGWISYSVLKTRKKMDYKFSMCIL